MRTLLIGSTGFIGSQIKAEFVRSAVPVLTLDRHEVDLTDEDSASYLATKFNDTTSIIFCAGIKKQHGDNFVNWQKNEMIIQNLVSALHEKTPNHLLFMSSAAVYGEDTDFPKTINESTSLVGSSYYGISKIAAENILVKTSKIRGFPLCITRPPLIYGTGDTSLGYGPTGFCHNATHSKPITLWGDGSELREFISVEDLAKICLILSKKSFDGILNIVSGKSVSFQDLLGMIETQGFTDLKIEQKHRTKDKVDHCFDPHALYNAIGRYEFVSPHDGIKDLLQAFQKERLK